MAAVETKQVIASISGTDFESIHKLPADRRYTNISVFWIFYYPSVIRLLYRLQIRHEAVTIMSILCGIVAAFAILQANSFTGYVFAAVFVHFKDLFDACDGALARLTGTGSRFGRFLDTLGDGLVFSAWIVVTAWRGTSGGPFAPWSPFWAAAAWLSLFLQCSYFNFHQLHYIRLSGASGTSQLDERSIPARGVVGFMALAYDLWFGWQDRLVALWDSGQRRICGLPSNSYDSDNARWYGRRSLMVANSALCYGTHAFVLIVCLLFESPFWLLPVVAVGMNLYWLGIVLARFLVFRRPA